MSEPTLDYDPLQEQIRAALSSAADVARDLEAMEPHVPETCRALIGSLVKELHKGKFLQRKVACDLQVMIDHVAREITCGERHEIIVDEHYAEGVYSQVVYTRKAEVLRERLPRLLQMQAYLNAVHHICAAETLALELRADRRC